MTVLIDLLTKPHAGSSPLPMSVMVSVAWRRNSRQWSHVVWAICCSSRVPYATGQTQSLQVDTVTASAPDMYNRVHCDPDFLRGSSSRTFSVVFHYINVRKLHLELELGIVLLSVSGLSSRIQGEFPGMGEFPRGKSSQEGHVLHRVR